MIEFINVSKAFNGKKVLDNVNLKIEKGETFVIIGQSGVGKTLALRHISGFVEPDSGTVLVDGIQMNGSAPKIKIKLRERMGVVFQSGALLSWLTVEENVALPLIERRLFPKNKIDKMVNDMLAHLQLVDAKAKIPAEISGGMKKRVALARVLVRNPDIILYDEPTTGLDPVMSSVINDLIRRMQKDFNVTSLVVTHDMKSALYIGDRIGMLYNGQIVLSDTPEGILNTANPIVKQFINGGLEGPIRVN